MKLSEKTKEFIRKIHALAEKGVDGEKETAKMKLQDILEKYGVTIEDIVGEKKKIRKFRFGKDLRRGGFMSQVVASVIGTKRSDEMKVGASRRSGAVNKLLVLITDAEFVEISEKIEFYWKHLEEEIKVFTKAFYYKNDLVVKREEEEDTPQRELTDNEIEELEKISKMMNGIQHKSLQKKLGHSKMLNEPEGKYYKSK